MIIRPEDRVRQIKQSLMEKLYKSPAWLTPKKLEFQTQLNKLKKYPTLAKSTLNNKFLRNNIFLLSTGKLKSDALRIPNPYTEVNKYLVNRQANPNNDDPDIDECVESDLPIDDRQQFFEGSEEFGSDLNEPSLRMNLAGKLGGRDYSYIGKLDRGPGSEIGEDAGTVTGKERSWSRPEDENLASKMNILSGFTERSSSVSLGLAKNIVLPGIFFFLF
jgi:hypothetical protein